MNYLCLDYGTRRVGVAIASTPIAEPLEVIPNKSLSASDVVTPAVLSRIQELIQKYDIETVIVGVSEEAMAQKTKQFIARLAGIISQPIEEMDETLSTYQTFEQMRSMKKSKREGMRDHYAAANILQNYLDLHTQSFSETL